MDEPTLSNLFLKQIFFSQNILNTRLSEGQPLAASSCETKIIISELK